MAMRNLGILVVLIAQFTGCAHQPVDVDVPATITNPSKATYQELEQILSTALKGMPVILADDALTKSDRLIIERKMQFDPQGNPIMGRELGTPYQFRLVKRNNTCILVNATSGDRWPLVKAKCTTEQ